MRKIKKFTEGMLVKQFHINIMNLKKRFVLVFMSKNKLLFFVQDLLNFSGSYRDLDSEKNGLCLYQKF